MFRPTSGKKTAIGPSQLEMHRLDLAGRNRGMASLRKESIQPISNTRHQRGLCVLCATAVVDPRKILLAKRCPGNALVTQTVDETARVAIEFPMNRIMFRGGNRAPPREQIPMPRLVIGQSCAPPCGASCFESHTCSA